MVCGPLDGGRNDHDTNLHVERPVSMKWKYLEEPCPLRICKSVWLVGSMNRAWQAQCQQPDNCGKSGCNIVKHSAVYKPLYTPGKGHNDRQD